MTYERVVVTIKSTGPDPTKHLPVEVAWWNVSTSDRGCFIPAHDVHAALNGCHVDTIRTIGYLDRLADAPQDDGPEALRLAENLHNSILVCEQPMPTTLLLGGMFHHYSSEIDPEVSEPELSDVIDVRSLAAGVLGLAVLPDLAEICERTGVPLEAVHTAETDADALGKVVLRLTELADRNGRRARTRANVPSALELTDNYVERLNAIGPDMVTFNGDGERQTYVIDFAAIATAAADTYLPVINTLWDEAAEIQRQFSELASKTTTLTQEWEARCAGLQADLDRTNAILQTPVTDSETAERVKAVVRAWLPTTDPANDDSDVLADAVMAEVSPVLATKDAQIAERDKQLADQREEFGHAVADHVRQVDELRAEQSSREAETTEAMDLELAKYTPWDPFTLPVTELAIGPSTAPARADGVFSAEFAPEFQVEETPPATPEPAPAPTRVYDGYEHGPLPICPAPYDCGHPRLVHDVVDFDDPIPLCCAEVDGAACRCGAPPAGWRRMGGQRVWQNGDTIPRGVHVLALDGGIYGFDLNDEWVNEGLGPVVEVEAVNPPKPPVDEVYAVPAAAEADS